MTDLWSTQFLPALVESGHVSGLFAFRVELHDSLASCGDSCEF